MNETNYGFGTRLSGVGVEQAIERVTRALQEEGFGVLSTIDVQATLRKKLDVEFRPYTILGACNPHLAKRALDAEEQIGLLLPCNVVVQRLGDGSVGVSIADPKAMFQFVDNPALAPVAEEAERKLRNVMAKLAAQ